MSDPDTVDPGYHTPLCVVCGKRKKPRGRSSPLPSMYCSSKCRGYDLPPLPHRHLWPGETYEEFGWKPEGKNNE